MKFARALAQRIRSAVQAVDRRAGTHIWDASVSALRLLKDARGTRGRLSVIGSGLRFATGRPGARSVLLPVGSSVVEVTLPDTAAYRALAEVFSGDDYPPVPGAAPRTVLDLGASIGASALRYRQLYPDARIICVEASPTLIPVLEHNTRSVGAEVVHAAVAGENGEVHFAAAAQSWGGTTVSAASDGQTVAVPAVALDELIERYKPDLVKIDVEGAEYEVFARSARLEDVRAFVGEIHSLPDEPQTGELLDRFSGFDVTATSKGRMTMFEAVRTSSATSGPTV